MYATFRWIVSKVDNRSFPRCAAVMSWWALARGCRRPTARGGWCWSFSGPKSGIKGRWTLLPWVWILSIYHSGRARVEHIWFSSVCLCGSYDIRLIISAKPQAAPFYARGSFQYMTYKDAEGDILCAVVLKQVDDTSLHRNLRTYTLWYRYSPYAYAPIWGPR